MLLTRDKASFSADFLLQSTMCISMQPSLQVCAPASSIEPVSDFIIHLLQAKDPNTGTLIVLLRLYDIHKHQIISSSPRRSSQHVLPCPPRPASRQRIRKRPSSTIHSSSKRHSSSFLGSLQFPKRRHQWPAALCLWQRVHM